MAEIKLETLALEGLRERGLADAQALTAKAAAGEADGTYLLARTEAIPTWRQRSFAGEDTPIGKPYRWKGQVYTLAQHHDAAGQPDWSPDKAVSLWDICHTRAPADAAAYTDPQGSRGLWQEGECCTWQDRVYRCLGADVAYGPGVLPERWQDLGPVGTLG